MSASPRKTIGTFEVEDVLGQGGMGVVYLARQPALDRRVVIKALRRELCDDSRSEERFLREAQAAAAVHHQNVVAVYDCFLWRGDRFISQEFVEGADLSSILQTVGKLEPRVAGLIALELARGLEEIHARGIVHRDLKPSNVIIGRGGEAKIADFGIALDSKSPGLTRTGHAVGTPIYMSPEQLIGDRVDYRSDLFSFGTLIYEMLTGETPFADGESQGGTGLLRRMEEGRYRSPRFRSPRAPGWIVRLVRRCLRPKARRRTQSATLLRQTLEKHLGSPAPADCRREIAAWMWSRDVFGSSEAEETRVAASVRPPPPRTGRLRLAVALVSGGLLLFGIASSTGRLKVREAPVLSRLLGTGERSAGGEVPRPRPLFP